MDVLQDVASLLAQERALTGQRLVQELLRQAGGVKREQGRLVTGAAGSPLHQETALLATVQRATGAAAALFDGDRLIASIGAGAEAPAGAAEVGAAQAASEAAGARAIGTRAPEAAAGAALGRGESWSGPESFGGAEWFASYAPLRGTNGEVFGMAALFLRTEDLQAAAQTLRPALELSRGERTEDSRRRAAAQKVIQLLDRTTTRLRIVALNAAIISARFGQRTGFDVVAGEMGKLTAEVRELLATVEAALLGEDVREPALPAAQSADRPKP